MKKSIQHKAKKWVIGIFLSPFVLFLLLAVLLYLPPVQNFVVHRVAASLSESTGMNISVSRVRLSFPLDLSVNTDAPYQTGRPPNGPYPFQP